MVTSVDELRGKLFWNRLKKNNKVPDLSTLPPCSSSLRKHTARAHYIAKMWKLADAPIQSLDHFDCNGWLPDGTIDWIDEPYPSDVEILFTVQQNSPSIEDDEEDDDMTESEQDDGDLTDNEDEED